MCARYRMRDVTWAAGNTLQIPLDSLPPGQRVRRIELHVGISGTKDAADATAGNRAALAITRIQVGNLVNVTGWSLWQLMKQIYGREVGVPTDIPGSGTTWTFDFPIEIPFKDPRQPGADDGSIPTELLAGKVVEITFAAANVWGVGNLITTAGTVRCQCETSHGQGIPQIQQIGEFDPGATSFQILPGVYKDLFLLDGTADGTVTTAEVTSVDLHGDGEYWLNNALHQQIVSAYNTSGIRDSASNVTINAAAQLPLVWMPQDGKANLTKQFAVEKMGQIQLTGSLNPRVVYWRAVEKDEVTLKSIAAQISEIGRAHV